MGDHPGNSGGETTRNTTRFETEETETTAQQVTGTPKKGRRFKRQKSIIVNYSHKQLTKDHVNILNKGFKFIPTSRPDHKAKYIQDYLLFERRLRLKYHFTRQYQQEEEDSSDDDIYADTDDTPTTHPLSESSGWTPPTGQDPHLDTYCLLTQEELYHTTTRPPKYYNLTKKERDALHDLANDTEIVIKPADKGGKIVIMDRQDYEQDCERQLQDEEHYTEVLPNHYKTIQRDIKDTLQTLRNQNAIDETTQNQLYNPRARIPPFYTIPKIHKEGNPGRPIVSGIQSPTENISKFVDFHIKDYVPKIDSYVKDTTHFINILQDYELEPGDLLVTLDVKALYTNIPHAEGLQALNETLTNNNHQNPPPWALVRLADLVLKNNMFQFNNKFYLQNQGTAMGTKMAPSYAILYMANFEQHALTTYRLRPKLWIRYIDDIFLIWQHGNQELELFVEFLNTINGTIRFTCESDPEKLPFLDVTVIRGEDNKMDTTLYIKPTDAQAYLHYSSEHPATTKNSIPFSQFLRIRKICSKIEDYNYHASRLYNIFKERGYKETQMRDTIQRVREMDRTDLLKYTQPKAEQKIRLITNFNRANPDMRKAIHKHDPVLQRIRKTKITPDDFQVTYSRSRNLRDILVHSSHPHIKLPQGCYPCNKPCATCPLIQTTRTVTNRDNQVYKVNGHFTCQSYNVVYLLTCRICKIDYVGETSQTLNNRIRGHISCIRNKRDNPVALHFNKRNHTTNDVQITILDRAIKKNERLRLEEAWMLVMRSRYPLGLNGRN